MMEKPELTDLYDIYEFRFVPFWKELWFKVVMGVFLGTVVVAVLLAIGFAIKTWYFKKRLSYADRALQELDALDSFIEHSKPAEFYTALVAILKSYLSERYAVRFTSKTDVQLVTDIADLPLSADCLPLLHGIFTNATAARFANEQVDQAHMVADLERVILVVKKTMLMQEQKTCYDKR
jgi:hypothetical protein